MQASAADSRAGALRPAKAIPILWVFSLALLRSRHRRGAPLKASSRLVPGRRDRRRWQLDRLCCQVGLRSSYELL
jgi:hypothetical protein